jgi:hypothetical protein
MPWSEVDSGVGGGLNAASVTGLNLSGSTILIAFVGYYNASALVAGDIADTSSNTWTALTARDQAGDPNIKGQFFFVINPTVSGSQDVTVMNSGGHLGLTVIGLTGFTATFDSQGTGDPFSSGETSAQAPSIGSAGDLVISGLGWDKGVTGISIDSLFSAVIEQAYVGATNEGAAIAWKEVSGSVQPTWSFSQPGGGDANGVAQNINFTSSGGGGSHPARIIIEKAS